EGLGGPIRECGLTLWAWAGGSAGPHVPHRPPFVSIPHRAFRRRQDLAAAAVISVDEADTRFDHPVWSRRGDAVTRLRGDIAPPYRHRISGFSSARPHDDIRKCRAAITRDGPSGR